jgi:hypothetical protein
VNTGLPGQNIRPDDDTDRVNTIEHRSSVKAGRPIRLLAVAVISPGNEIGY